MKPNDNKISSHNKTECLKLESVHTNRFRRDRLMFPNVIPHTPHTAVDQLSGSKDIVFLVIYVVLIIQLQVIEFILYHQLWHSNTLLMSAEIVPAKSSWLRSNTHLFFSSLGFVENPFLNDFTVVRVRGNLTKQWWPCGHHLTSRCDASDRALTEATHWQAHPHPHMLRHTHTCSGIGGLWRGGPLGLDA